MQQAIYASFARAMAGDGDKDSGAADDDNGDDEGNRQGVQES